MAVIFILEHKNDDSYYFSNVDSALDMIYRMLEYDDQIENYELMRYELDPDTQEYLITECYDLNELIDNKSSDAISCLDSE